MEKRNYKYNRYNKSNQNTKIKKFPAKKSLNNKKTKTNVKAKNSLYYSQDYPLYANNKGSNNYRSSYSKSSYRRSSYSLDNTKNVYYTPYQYKYKQSYSKYPKKPYYKKPIRTKKRNNLAIARLFTSCMFILIISYFGISIYKSLNKEAITYSTLNYGTIANQNTTKGILIRDEQVYTASRSGALSFYKQENEKVKKGELIASIKDEEATEMTEQDLETINQKILEIQQNRDELSLFSEEVSKINSQIQEVLDNNIFELAQNDMSALYEINDSVTKKIDTRNKMLLSESSGSLSSLAEEKSTKEQYIDENTQNIYSNEAGLLSFYIDGLEDTLNISNISELTEEDTKLTPNKNDITDTYKVQVEEGDVIFKIVKSNTFYIASSIKTDYITDWEEGDRRTIYINDGGGYKEQEVTISKIELGEKTSYVLMQCTKNILDFIDTRNITFEVSLPKEGFKINNTAIAEKTLLKIPLSYIQNGVVTKKTDDTTKDIVLSEYEENEAENLAYIPIQYGVLNIGDTIINKTTNEEYTIQDTYTVKGIYVVNSGTYQFKKINLDNSVSDEDFTVLDTALNTNIKIYDRYITDYKTVIEEGLIY